MFKKNLNRHLVCSKYNFITHRRHLFFSVICLQAFSSPCTYNSVIVIPPFHSAIILKLNVVECTCCIVARPTVFQSHCNADISREQICLSKSHL